MSKVEEIMKARGIKDDFIKGWMKNGAYLYTGTGYKVLLLNNAMTRRIAVSPEYKFVKSSELENTIERNPECLDKLSLDLYISHRYHTSVPTTTGELKTEEKNTTNKDNDKAKQSEKPASEKSAEAIAGESRRAEQCNRADECMYL